MRKRAQTAGSGAGKGGQGAPQLVARIFVIADGCEVAQSDARGIHAIFDRICRKAAVVPLAAEPFLLGGGDDAPFGHKGGGAVVVIGRQPQMVTGHSAASCRCKGVWW